jgi:hypothetical protein
LVAAAFSAAVGAAVEATTSRLITEPTANLPNNGFMRMSFISF